MDAAQRGSLKKLGSVAGTGALGIVIGGYAIFAAGFLYEIHRQKKQKQNQASRVPIAEYNETVRHYNYIVTRVNAKLEAIDPSLPKLQTTLEQLEAEAFNAEFDDIINKHW